MTRSRTNCKPTLEPWLRAEHRPEFQRETWEGKSRLLPELEIFGWLRFQQSLSEGLQPDSHPGAFELHYLKHGHLKWTVKEKTHDFRKGAIFIIHPGELHCGEEQSLQRCEHMWLRIKFPEAANSLPGLTVKETALLRHGLEIIRHPTFSVTEEVGYYWEMLLNAHHIADRGSAITARGLLHAILASLARDYRDFVSRVGRREPTITFRIRRALQILDANRELDNLRISEIAKQVGMSESGFRRRFTSETGASPHDYALERRVEDARRLLTGTGRSITRIAVDLGFSSGQYFATVFRRRVGVSPSKYRNRQKLLVQA